MTVKAGSRVVLMLRGKERDATVLGLVQDPAHTTPDGDPALNLAYFDETRTEIIGTPQWPEAFVKLDAVKHSDHDDVQDGKEIAAWDYAWGESEMGKIGNYLTVNFSKDLRSGDTASALIARLGDELKGWREGTRKRYSDGSTAMSPLGGPQLPDTPPSAPAKRPTIEELERILASDEKQDVRVNPDGSVTATPVNAPPAGSEAPTPITTEADASKKPDKVCTTCGGTLVATNGVDVPAGYVHATEPTDGHFPSYGPDAASNEANQPDNVPASEAINESLRAPDPTPASDASEPSGSTSDGTSAAEASEEPVTA